MTQINDIRLPAEWEKHDSTIICWPHNKEDWPGKFHTIPAVYLQIITHIIDGEIVRIIVQSLNHLEEVKKILLNANILLENIRFIILETDRGWIRDTSPFFVKQENAIRAVNFEFNGWAKYNDYQKDRLIPEALNKHLALHNIETEYLSKKIVLEGGSVDCNGQGTLITTEECLINPNQQVRNAGFTKKDYEEVFSKYMGIKKVIWLTKGIIGDDTHGHVDDIARFVNDNTLVACREQNPNDANYLALNENIERLQNETRADGSPLNIVILPMPSALVFKNQRLPASYANFYISNNTVLVPTFNDDNDRMALNIFSELFPERKVHGIDAVDLVWGLGTIHCLTHEVPA